jgi:hypothetical protein
VSRAGARVATAFALLLALVVGWRLRVELAHGNPAWDETATKTQAGLLRSDPALLHWFTDRIARNGGSLPHAFEQCPDVQWPDVVDARVEFPMLQPWLAANLWLRFGKPGGTPLHEFCLSLFSFTAAITALAAFGIAFELTRRRGLAFVALALALLLPANWRTASFVLLGEDVAFPCLALHLWLLARAARVRSAASFLLAGVFLALAMAAWHATGFFVAIEAGAFLAWTLRSGENPFLEADADARSRRLSKAWLVLVPFAIACAFEPMLRGKLQLLSLPMQLALALLALAFVERRRRLAPVARVVAAVALVGLLLGAGLLVSRALGRGLGDYSHVFRLVAAKLATFGERPSDPRELPFEVRILWQGPFDTMSLSALLLHLSSGLVALALLVPTAWRVFTSGRGERGAVVAALVALVGVVALVATRLILRTEILAGLVLAVAAALAIGRLEPGARRRWLAAAIVALPAAIFPFFFFGFRSSNQWYEPFTIAEYRATLEAVDRLVPRGEAVAADEILSTAILATTDRPILVQPKYEWTAARERLQEFRTVATLGSPAELAAFLRDHRCRFLALDVQTLAATRYQVGLADSTSASDLDPKSAFVVAARDPEHLPGFELLWRADPNVAPRGGVRLYRLSEGSASGGSAPAPR